MPDIASTRFVDPLDAWKDRLGRESDGAIAAEAGVDRAVVGDYRRRLGIPAYTGHWTRGKAAQVARVESVAEVAPAVEPLISPATEAEASPAPDAGAAETDPVRAVHHRRTRMDPFLHLIGVSSDAEVASLAGVTPQNVRNWRLRHGVPSSAPSAPDVSVPLEAVPVGAASPTEVPAADLVIEPVERTAPAPVMEPANLPQPEGGPREAATQAPPPPILAPEPGSLHAFAVTAVCGDRQERFGVNGRDITEAVARAVAGLARRADGPWVVRRVAWLAEALG